MIETIYDKRRWFFRVNPDRLETTTVNYTISLKDKKITEIRNQAGYVVETTSECWEFFNKKYSGAHIAN